MKITAKVIAYGFTALLLLLGFVLVFSGAFYEKQVMIDYGWTMVQISIGLYVLSLFVRLLQTAARRK